MDTVINDQSAIILQEHNRFNRQSDFVPLLSLEDKEATVIGVGAIGRAVALQLAAIGVRRLLLIDFDTVSVTNVTTQGFLKEDVYKEKVHAVEDAILAIDDGIRVDTICDRFRPSHKISDYVFLCVDCIRARTVIFNQLKDKTKLIIDGRMLGEVWRVLSVWDENSKKHYEASLFPKEIQEQGRCTGHATIYSAQMPASWMVHQFTRYLRGSLLDVDMQCNMLAGELLPVIDP